METISTIWHPDTKLKFMLICAKFNVKVCQMSEPKFLLLSKNQFKNLFSVEH